MSDQELSLQLVRVKCGDETGGSNVERVGNDEIWLSGFAVDATATVQKLEQSLPRRTSAGATGQNCHQRRCFSIAGMAAPTTLPIIGK